MDYIQKPDAICGPKTLVICRKDEKYKNLYVNITSQTFRKGSGITLTAKKKKKKKNQWIYSQESILEFEDFKNKQSYNTYTTYGNIICNSKILETTLMPIERS